VIMAMAYDLFLTVYSLKTEDLGGVCGTWIHKQPHFFTLGRKKT
jgi:hypothetical protein